MYSSYVFSVCTYVHVIYTTHTPGCGSGFPCVYTMRHPFVQVIGVELHPETARLAEENIKRSMQLTEGGQHSAGRPCCRNYRILCEDMLHFDFSSITSSSNLGSSGRGEVDSLVLFMYEPLWTLPKAEAHAMYHSVICNAIFDAPSCVKEVYFVYLFAGTYGGDALTAFRALSQEMPDTLQLVCEEEYFGLFFGYSDNMYIYRATLDTVSAEQREQRHRARKKARKRRGGHGSKSLQGVVGHLNQHKTRQM